MAAVLWLAGCGRAGPALASPAQDGATTARISTPARTAAPAPTLPPAPNGPPFSLGDGAFDCRLPVFPSGGGFLQQPGFLNPRSGVFTPDPSAAFTSAGGDLYHSSASPTLTGAMKGWPSYDAAARRWLPAGRPAITPDGLSYAYTERHDNPRQPGHLPRWATVHVVDVRSGVDRVVHDGPALAVLDFEPSALYMIGAPADEGASGLWRIDPETGATKELRPDGFFYGVAGNGAWFSSRGYGPNDHLDRLDLSTGETESWLSTPGLDLGVSAFAAGLPLVSVGQAGSASRLLLLTSATTRREVASEGMWPYMFSTEVFYVADAHGVWLGYGGGIVLVSDAGVRTFEKEPYYPVGSCS